MSTVRCNFHNFLRRRLTGHKIYKDLYGQGFQFQVEKALVGTFCEILLTHWKTNPSRQSGSLTSLVLDGTLYMMFIWMSNINLLFRDHLCKSLITGCAVTVPRDSLLRFLSILLCPKFSDSPALEMTANTEDVCQSLTPLFTQHRVGDGEKMRKYYSANIDKIFLHLLLLFSTSTRYTLLSAKQTYIS